MQLFNKTQTRSRLVGLQAVRGSVSKATSGTGTRQHLSMAWLLPPSASPRHSLAMGHFSSGHSPGMVRELREPQDTTRRVTHSVLSDSLVPRWARHSSPMPGGSWGLWVPERKKGRNRFNRGCVRGKKAGNRTGGAWGGKKEGNGTECVRGENEGWSPCTLRVHCSAPLGVRRATIAAQTAAAGQI